MQINRISNINFNNYTNANKRLSFKAEDDFFEANLGLRRWEIEENYAFSDEATLAKLETFDILKDNIPDSDLRNIVNNVDENNVALVRALVGNKEIDPQNLCKLHCKIK